MNDLIIGSLNVMFWIG